MALSAASTPRVDGAVGAYVLSGLRQGKAPVSEGIRVTVEDLETGEVQTQEIDDDYVLITAGSCHVAHTNVYSSGTHVITIKGRGE